MVHWHEDNPWREKVVYVPINALADCLSGAIADLPATNNYPRRSPEQMVSDWHRSGDALDAYILPSSNGDHQVGIRYGSEPDAYLSLFVPHPSILEELLDRYSSANSPHL